jgi:hypothetical protein
MEQESNRVNEDELREELMQDHYERMLSEYAV